MQVSETIRRIPHINRGAEPPTTAEAAFADVRPALCVSLTIEISMLECLQVKPNDPRFIKDVAAAGASVSVVSS
jgi:hypothetical protein